MERSGTDSAARLLLLPLPPPRTDGGMDGRVGADQGWGRFRGGFASAMIRRLRGAQGAAAVSNGRMDGRVGWGGSGERAGGGSADPTCC